MSFPTPYHADSDADDEYERSVMTSPHLPTDSEASPTDSDPPSTEHTPTTYGNMAEERGSPKALITEWTTEDSADFVTSLNLSQYVDTFIENEIVGEALIALKHDELKEMGITSVGHRLTILKGVYDIKVKQGVLIDSDHYVPLSADQSQDENATQDDVSRLIKVIRERDKRIAMVETELRKMADDYRKLREELLPIFKLTKDKSQPLPYQPPHGSDSPELHNHDQSLASPQNEKPGTMRSRSFSRRIFPGSTPKNNSPTHIPQSIPEGRAVADSSNLDPSAAAVAASTHLTASMNGGSQLSPKGASMPSPTSPAGYYGQQTLASRSYSREGSTTASSHYYSTEDAQSTRPSTATPGPASGRTDPPSATGQGSMSSARSVTGESAPSVEIFKSFRVSMEDPCHKVLPAALKKYNINADWRQYALYIVYGDQERCLGLEERPLILFKQLEKEGRKPMFMLRKHTQPTEGHTSSVYSSANPTNVSAPGSASFESSVGVGGARGNPAQGTIQLPGGVL